MGIQDLFSEIPVSPELYAQFCISKQFFSGLLTGIMKKLPVP